MPDLPTARPSAAPRRLFGALALSAALLSPAALHAQGGAINEEARAYFKNGVELVSDPKTANYQDAYYQFKLAYEKSGRSWKVLGNLGLCAFKLERDAEAIEHYSRYLEQGGTEVSADERKAIERDLLLLRGNLATVVLSSDVADLQIVDARAGSAAPPQSYALAGGKKSLGLRAGSHVLVARSGGKEQRWEVGLTPGQSVEHTFRFGDAPVVGPVAATPSAPSAVTEPQPAPKQGNKLRTAGFVAAGVGGAMLVSGVVTGLMSRSAHSSGRDACRGSLCPESSRSDFDRAKSLASVTNVLLIGGTLVAATGVTLIVVSPSKEKPTSVALTPSALPTGAGLTARGVF